MSAASAMAAKEFGNGSRTPDSPQPSLFILSLPRSLSSLVHKTCCAALGFRNPAWTSDGEILNIERSTFLSDRAVGAKYSQAHQVHLFGPATDFLDEVVQPSGFCYKDVTQPFVTSAWLRAHPDIRVLKIVPNFAHVAYAMLRRRWFYPSIASQAATTAMPARVMAGLIKASAAIATVPGESVAFDDLVTGVEPLRQALLRLYPEIDLRTLDFGADFATGQADVLGRRELPDYKVLQELGRTMTSELASN